MVKILAFILGWQREAIVEKWLNYMSLTFFFFLNSVEQSCEPV